MKSFTFAAAMVAITEATRIVYREDKLPEDYIVNREDFPFAFPWPMEDPICGGAMVTKQHMITAAHCVEHGPTPFNIEHRGNTYRVIEQRPLSCYTQKADEGFDIQFPADIAILVLEEPIPNAQAGVDFLDLWDVEEMNSTMEGKIFTLIGWGLSGKVGDDANFDGSMSVLHRAENKVNKIEDNTLIYTMDRPEDGGLELEGLGNSGDSGSPALIRNTVTGDWNIGGVKSWGMNGSGYDSTNGYTRLGGIAYSWIMKNLEFNADGLPKPWTKIADDKCELFLPDGYEEGAAGDDEWDWDDEEWDWEDEEWDWEDEDGENGDDFPIWWDDEDNNDGGNNDGGNGCTCECSCEVTVDCDHGDGGGDDMPPAGEDDMPPAGDDDMPPAGDDDMPPAGEDDMPPAGEDDAMPDNEEINWDDEEFDWDDEEFDWDDEEFDWDDEEYNPDEEGTGGDDEY